MFAAWNTASPSIEDSTKLNDQAATKREVVTNVASGSTPFSLEYRPRPRLNALLPNNSKNTPSMTAPVALSR